jgi:L-2-hydroxycarboxylate dehydrogenase (NAD+)
MIDRQGQPLTDPRRASEGFLVPVGGPKGYGLALMFGLLAGILNGAAFGRDVVDYIVESKTASNTGQTIMAVDVGAFADVQAFRQKLQLWRRSAFRVCSAGAFGSLTITSREITDDAEP